MIRDTLDGILGDILLSMKKLALPRIGVLECGDGSRGTCIFMAKMLKENQKCFTEPFFPC